MEFLVFFVFMLVYMFIGAMLGKRYWQQKHGVYKRVIGGGADVLFSSVFPWFFLWPVFLFIPKFREPELCQCPDHVQARATARRNAEAHQQALREERGYGR
jgi:hypothetical protein